MNFWVNLGFRWKLAIPVLVIAAIVALAAAANYRLMGDISEHANRIIAVHMPAVETMLEADRDLHQVLVAERSLIFIGPESAQYQVMLDEHRENLEQAEARLTSAFTLLQGDAVKAKAGQFQPLFERWRQTSVKIVRERTEGGRIGRTNAIEMTFGPGLEQFEQMRGMLDEMVQMTQQTAEAEGAEVQALIAREHVQQLVASLTTLLICAVMALLFPSLVVKPLNAMRERFEDMARGTGDLRVRLTADSQDELGKIAQAFNLFMDKLQALIVDIAKVTDSLADSSASLAATSKQSSVRINDQHRSVDLVATAVNEMGATVHEVATHTASTAQETRQAESSAAEGSQVLERTVTAIRDLAGEVEGTSQVIGELEQETGSIIAILNEIKGIAEQTNLLALNAAIEAARAGEQGRGFAVVAEEVRNLAGKTQQSTENINRMVERLKVGVGNAVSAMNAGCEKAARAVTQADEAGHSFAAITDAVTQINEMTLQIASSAEEQSAVVEDINKNLVEISRVAEESALGAQSAQESAEQLREWANRLRQIVGQFQT